MKKRNRSPRQSWDPRPKANLVALRRERDILASRVARGVASPDEAKRLSHVAALLRRPVKK